MDGVLIEQVEFMVIAIEAVVIALTTSIVFLFGLVINNHKETKNTLKICQEQHEEHSRKILQLVQQIGELKGHRDGYHEALEDIAERIIDYKKDN